MNKPNLPTTSYRYQFACIAQLLENIAIITRMRMCRFLRERGWIRCAYFTMSGDLKRAMFARKRAE